MKTNGVVLAGLLCIVGSLVANSAVAQWPGYPNGEVLPVAYEAPLPDSAGSSNLSPVHPVSQVRPVSHQVALANSTSRMQSLEAELASLQARVEQLSYDRVGVVDAGCGCDVAAGCGCADDGCCGCEGYRSGFYFNVEAVFAKPYYKESFEASVVRSDVGAPAVPLSQQLLPFQFGYDVTPRFTAGYTDCDGMGLRARYWQLDQNGDTRSLTGEVVNTDIFTPTANVVSVIFPATIAAPPGTTMVVNNSLKFQTLDLEGTQQVFVGPVELTLGAGLRYALLDQRYSAEVAATGSSLVWQRRFEGAGVTLSADGRRPIGCHGLAAVGSFRGAMLFGRKDMDRNVTNNQVAGVPDQVSLEDGDEVFGGGELSFGLEWEREFCGGRSVFVRGMYEGQLWTDAGAPTLTFLGFEGFAVSAGVLF